LAAMTQSSTALDMDALLNYAEFMAMSPGRLWEGAGWEQEARLQVFLVPTGLTWNGERVGTLPTGLLFSRLGESSGVAGDLVDLRALTWNRLGPFLRELDELQVAVV